MLSGGNMPVTERNVGPGAASRSAYCSRTNIYTSVQDHLGCPIITGASCGALRLPPVGLRKCIIQSTAKESDRPNYPSATSWIRVGPVKAYRARRDCFQILSRSGILDGRRSQSTFGACAYAGLAYKHACVDQFCSFHRQATDRRPKVRSGRDAVVTSFKKLIDRGSSPPGIRNSALARGR